MDVNGTKFHLLLGRADWGECRQVRDAKTANEDNARLDELWQAENGDPDFDWNADAGEITLRKHLFKFRASPKDKKPELINRRGAARDRYGNWYWIDESGLKIKILSTGSNTVSDFYPFAAGDCPEKPSSDFQPIETPAPKSPVALRGLAITIDHYLVVGTLEPAGLLVFDLFATGEPREILWRDDVDFTPYDISARFSGGVFVLDRDKRRYWTLDRGFEVVNEKESERDITEDLFQPSDTTVERRFNQVFSNERIFSELPDSVNPISIEALPDDTVLILDFPQPNEDFSVIRRYFQGQKLNDLSTAAIALEIEEDEDAPSVSPSGGFRLRGYDIAFLKAVDDEDADDEERYDRLFIVPEEGNQAFAFRMLCAGDLPVSSPPIVLPPQVVAKKFKLDLIKEYFPMRLFGGKGFTAAFGKVYFDFGERWLPLVKQNRPTFVTHGTLDTPIFDGKESNCVWHRLMLDACISSETKIAVYSRSGASENDMPETWQEEPKLYFRGNGSEIPFPADCVSGEKSRKTWELELQRFRDCVSKEKGKGTWELLLQKAKGRFLQLRLVFTGNGRQTPRISALRAYYPRFSYLNHYLPSIYREDEQSAFFLDRFLANFEGIYTNIEDKIAAAQMLFDVRSAPPDALEWLANWFGVVLDPAWTEEKRRLFIRHAVEFFQYRGTTRGLRIALRLALDSCADESLFDFQTREQKRRDPIRIVEKFLTRRTPQIIPADTLEEQNLPQISQETSRWTPKQGADVLHQRYRESFNGKLAREIATIQAGVKKWKNPSWMQAILMAVAQAQANVAIAEKKKNYQALFYPLIKPADAEEAAIWESFSLEALGFVPSDAAAREQKRWRDFLSGRYLNKIADLNTAHGTNYADVQQIFLPTGTETNAALKEDWQEFLDDTPDSQNRKRWQDFLARRYRRIAQLNSLYATKWNSFEAVSLFDRLPSSTKALGDWVQFEGSVLPMHVTAHRFTVLIPATLSGAKRETPEEQMRKLHLVKRVVDLEKPAHTICDFRYYWNLFRLEEVRLGLDTLLGLGSRDPLLHPALIVGEGYVGESHLGVLQPEKYSSRFVLNSEQLKKQKTKEG